MNFKSAAMSSGLRLIAKRTEPTELAQEFLNFYCDILPNIYDIKCPKFLDDIKVALKNMRRLKWDIDMQHTNEFYIDIKYEKPSVRCAYMYSYCILNTAIVYREFLNYLKNSDGAITRVITRKKLKICCLAGGPAFEAIGISKAIFDFVSQLSSEASSFTDVHVTVVDKVAEWEEEGQTLINVLNNSSKLFNSEKINFYYDFVKADVLFPFNHLLKSKVAEADIITVVKLASSIEEKSASVCVSCLDDMIKSVMDTMNEKRILFMLDLAGGKIFKHSVDVVSGRRNRYAKKVSLHKKYRLVPETLKTMETCLNFRNTAGTPTLFPTVLTTISSCLWMKKSMNQMTVEVKVKGTKNVGLKPDCNKDPGTNNDNDNPKKKKKKGCNQNKSK